MLSCDRISSSLSARLDGELPPARAAEVETHLAACAPCRALAQELALVDRFLTAEPELARDARLTARLRDQLDLDARLRPARVVALPPAAPPPPSLLRLGGPVAMALAVVALLMLLRTEPEPAVPTPDGSPPPQIARAFRSPAAERDAGLRPSPAPPVRPARRARPVEAERVASLLKAEMARLDLEIRELEGVVGAFRVSAAPESRNQHDRLVARSFEAWK